MKPWKSMRIIKKTITLRAEKSSPEGTDGEPGSQGTGHSRSKIKIKRKCCLCRNNGLTHSLFTFPQASDNRLGEWVKNCSKVNADIIDVEGSYLHKHYYVCSEHFSQSQFYNRMKNSLRKTAVPDKISSEMILKVNLTPLNKRACENGSDPFSSRSDATLFDNVPDADVKSHTNADDVNTLILPNEVPHGIKRQDFQDCFLSESQILSSETPQCTYANFEMEEKSEPNHKMEEEVEATSNMIGTNASCSKEGKSVHEVYRARRKKFSRVCCVPLCKNSNEHARMFSFPSIQHYCDDEDFKRCVEWVRSCGNRELLCVSPWILHKHFFICEAHFSSSSFTNKTRTTLLKNIVPDVFEQDGLCKADIDAYIARFSQCIDESNAVTFRYSW